MRNHLVHATTLLLVASLPLAAHGRPHRPGTPPARQRIVVLANLGDRSLVEVENLLLQDLARLHDSGALHEIANLEAHPLVVDVGQPGGEHPLNAWKLDGRFLPLLAVAQLEPDGTPGTVLFRTRVDDSGSALRDTLSYLRRSRAPSPSLLQAASFEPRSPGRPICSGEALRFKVQAPAGAQLTAQVGSVGSIALFERSPGLYEGDYTVGPRDGGDALIAVHATYPGRQRESRALGHLVLQGDKRPTLEGIVQIGAEQWLLHGTAWPGSQIYIRSEHSGRLGIRDVVRSSFRGQATTDGRYQVRIRLPARLAGYQATFWVSSTSPLGEATESAALARSFPTPGRYGSDTHGLSTTHSLCGTWRVGTRSASLRLGRWHDELIRRDADGQEQSMTVRGRRLRLRFRGFPPLQGVLARDQRTITWTDGTVWTRGWWP